MPRSASSFRWLAALALTLSGAAFADGAAIASFPPRSPPADLVLRDAIIATLDPLQPRVQAMAVRAGKVLALGSDEEMARYIAGKTRVLDLHGAFVAPGFIEGHGHLLQTGESLMELDLGKARSWDAIVAQVESAAAKAKPGEWILGQGWQQAKWTRKPQPNIDGAPLPDGLNAVSPRNPVLLWHASGHAIYVNALALRAAGITAKTPDPVGGSIVHDTRGEPIGMLRDTAERPVIAAFEQYQTTLPASELETLRRQSLQLAEQNEISKGVTTFVDMGEDFRTIDWLKQQAAKGLPLRLYVNVNDESAAELDRHLDAYRTIGFANDHFTVRGVGEILSDGALGTRSAWFLQPYSDAPDVTGKNVTPMSEIARIAAVSARDGFQLSVHAIGDRANEETLNLFQQVFAQDPAAHALRWRIEHAQHLAAADIPRFAQLGVIASMQSIHACSDVPMVIPRLGEERARVGAYVWHTLIDSGAIVVEGTDTPVEDTRPIPNFYCGVTRDDGHGMRFFPEQSKTRMQELRSYTWNNAYAIFQEQELGSLSPGKLADMVVISGDLLTLPAADILRTRVLYTIIGGRVVYTRPRAQAWRNGQLFDAMPEFNHAE